MYKVKTINIIAIYIFLIAVLLIFWAIYVPSKELAGSKTINWVITGENFGGKKNIQYSYDGFNFFPSRGNSLDFTYRGDYGLTTDKKNFMWMVGGEKVLSFSSNNPSINFSYNGWTWVNSNIHLGTTTDVAFGYDQNQDTRWVATGAGTFIPNNVMYSSNGMTWDFCTGLSFDVSEGIAYGKDIGSNNMWVATGRGKTSGNSNILYSYDDMIWQASTGASFQPNSGTLVEGRAIAYGTSTDKTTPMWLAGGFDFGTTSYNDSLLLYSNNGISWNKCTGISFVNGCFGIAFGKTILNDPRWVALGGLSATSTTTILYSDNGIEWKNTTGNTFSNTGYDVSFGKTTTNVPLWVAIGEEVEGNPSREVLYSTNGISWVSTTNNLGSLPLLGGGVISNVFTHGVKSIF
jgi:hypothetical protein